MTAKGAGSGAHEDPRRWAGELDARLRGGGRRVTSALQVSRGSRKKVPSSVSGHKVPCGKGPRISSITWEQVPMARAGACELSTWGTKIKTLKFQRKTDIHVEDSGQAFQQWCRKLLHRKLSPSFETELRAP